MYKSEREAEIMAILSESEYVTVEMLTQRIDISASSIRRDLKDLEDRGLVVRSYGGVKLSDRAQKGRPVGVRTQENAAVGRRIAQAAVALLQKGDTVFADASSPVLFTAEFLAAVEDLTIVTNSIELASALSDYAGKVYCTGGVLSDDNRAALVGESARAFLSGIRADVALCACEGVTPSGECFASSAEEAVLRRVMLQNARRRILLCESATWGKAAPFYQTHTDEVDYILSEQDPAQFFADPTPEKYRM